MNEIAISVKQPWAYLLCAGIKDIENRTWKCPQKYIGQRVLIHASVKSWTWHAVLNYLTGKMANVFERMGFNGKWLRNLQTSAILGSVVIKDCVINHPSVWAEKGVYNWVLSDPILFEKPIVGVKGKLGFWDCSHLIHSEPHNGQPICLCDIPVKEEDQVLRLVGEYRCKYCGGIWYK